QWKFLIHTLLQSLSAKRTSWNEFSSAMASANQIGDLSTHTTRYISPALTQKVFENIRQVGKGFSGVETLLFEGMLAAREITEEGITEEQVQADDAWFDANMRFMFKSREEMEQEDQEVLKSINETPAQKAAKRRKLNDEAQEAEDLKKCLEVVDDDVFTESTPLARKETVAEDVANEAIPSTPTLLILPSPPSHDIPSTAQKLEIIMLKAGVKRLERDNKVKSSKLRRLKKVRTSQRIESSDDMEDVFNQGRMIDDLDKDKGIELVVDQVKDVDTTETEGSHAAEQAKKQAEIYHLDLDHPSKVLSMQEDDSKVQEVVEVVTTAKLITEVVTTATSQVSAASATISAAKPSIPAAAPIVVVANTRRRKGVIIRDPEEELSSKTPTETPKLKDKGKGILIETPKPMKKKDQIELDAEYARKLHEEINKDHEEINKDID
nr:hypothetical protein [Tanacetum cinerariifolium]